jgi:hypothetical protein
MHIKRVRKGVWRVSGILEGMWPEEDSMEAEDLAIAAQVSVDAENGGALVLGRAWLGGSACADSERWIVRSWIEEHEDEILAELEGEGSP